MDNVDLNQQILDSLNGTNKRLDDFILYVQERDSSVGAGTSATADVPTADTLTVLTSIDNTSQTIGVLGFVGVVILSLMAGMFLAKIIWRKF